jgi:effector-binding domain-containing protein
VQWAHRREFTMPNVVMALTYESIATQATFAKDELALPPEIVKLLAEAEQPAAPTPLEVKIQELGSQHTATIRVTCKPTEISKTLAVIFPEVMACLNSTGAKTTGAPFTRYHEISNEQMDLEAGVPVAERFAGKGRIKPSTLPAGEMAITWHVGPYHELQRTHAQMTAWLAHNNYDPAAPFWEIYMTDPGQEPDPKKWRTQIVVPVARK